MNDFAEETLQEFQRLWREEFGEAISLEFARTRLGEVIALFTFLAEWSLDQTTEPPTLPNEIPPLLPQIE